MKKNGKHREAPTIAGMLRGKAARIKGIIAGRVAVQDLAGYHPAHAAYIYAQNQMSAMSESLTALNEMAPFTELFSEAEDLYIPNGPPISPLTPSYFTSWAFFDACAGPANETIGAIVLELGPAFGMRTELLHVIRLMQESRMGLYAQDGIVGGLVVLREVVTGTVCRAISPAGYLGRKGELWYARVLPPPIPGGSEHVVFTTPYIVLKPGLHEWQAYFDRTLPKAGPKAGPETGELARRQAYERHMKYGPTRTYWNEYVFEGYVNHRTEVIFLAGLPDLPESRPNSSVNFWR